MVNAPSIRIDGREIGQAQDMWQGYQQAIDEFLKGKPAFQVGKTYEMRVHGIVPCEYWQGAGAGALGGAIAGGIIGVALAGPTLGISVIVGIAGGALFGAAGGAAVADMGCKYWKVNVYDIFGGQKTMLISENGGQSDREFIRQLQFSNAGPHTIEGVITTAGIFDSVGDYNIAVIPIPLYLPANKHCVILSPSHDSQIISGEVRRKDDGALVTQVGLDVVDYRVYPLLKEDADKAAEVDNMPYDPKTGQANIADGYYGGFFDAINSQGYWSWPDKFWVDQAKGVYELPRKAVTFVQPKDMENPDISTWKYGKAYVPPIMAEKITRYFLNKNMSTYDIHMEAIPESWTVLLPFIVSGKVVKIDDTMMDCSQGTPVSGATVELIDNGKAVGSTTTLGDGSYVFTYSSMNEGNHKIQARVKVPAQSGMTDMAITEPQTVYLMGGSQLLSPWGLVLIGAIVVGGIGLYIAVNR